jgi:alpha-amylase
MINQTLIQYFHWYNTEKQEIWNAAAEEAENLSELGITLVWFPPAYKSTEGVNSAGYDCYDLFDLGEFDQKNSIPTRYGTKEEYLTSIKTLQEKGIKVIADVVFNHKSGADELERVAVTRVNPDNRNEHVSGVFEIEAWTKFTFPGRKKQYSEFIWDKNCFSGIDWAEDLQETSIFSIQNEYGKGWEDVPSDEMGNFDYLMFNDIDFRNPAVREELKRWGEWYYETCKMDGFRMDAVKHIAPGYLNEWLDHMKAKFNKEFFVIAENWVIDRVESLTDYIDMTEGRMQLFDSLLHLNFYRAAKEEDYDLSAIFENTLTKYSPHLSITFVDNHDSQPLQSLESYVDFWFRPHGYALILLREQGIPCVFYPDLYGAKYSDITANGEEAEVELIAMKELPLLLKIRKDFSYGIQKDYFDFPSCIGWTRAGETDKEQSGIAVVMSIGGDGWKHMEMGPDFKGRTFIDVLGHVKEEVIIDEDGWAGFSCKEKSVSVWILKEV